MIGEPVLLEVVRADLLAAAATADLRLAGRRRLGAGLVLGLLQQAGARSTTIARALFWSWLRSSCMRDDDARRDVGDAHGGVRRVHALTTRAAGAEHVDLQVALVDVDVHLFGLGHDEHRRRRRVDAPLALGDRHRCTRWGPPSNLSRDQAVSPRTSIVTLA